MRLVAIRVDVVAELFTAVLAQRLRAIPELLRHLFVVVGALVEHAGGLGQLLHDHQRCAHPDGVAAAAGGGPFVRRLRVVERPPSQDRRTLAPAGGTGGRMIMFFRP